MKKIFKAISMLALTSVMACGIAACGGGDNGEVDSSGNTIVKIMFHVDEKSTEGQAYKKRIDAFNTAYKDKKIKASATYKARTAGASSYETELNLLKTEGTLPDIITFDAPNCASYAQSKYLYDISSLVPQDIQDDFLSLNKYDGKLYGLPIQESSAGFYYNKKIFRDANIDVSSYTVENPWTFDQFKQVCAQIKASGKTAVDMRMDATKDETATYLLYPFIYASGGSFASDDGYTATGYFDSAASQNGFRFLRYLCKPRRLGAFALSAGRCEGERNGKLVLRHNRQQPQGQICRKRAFALAYFNRKLGSDYRRNGYDCRTQIGK